MPGKIIDLKLTEKDFKDLASGVRSVNSKTAEWLSEAKIIETYSKLKTYEEKYEFYRKIMYVSGKDWEYYYSSHREKDDAVIGRLNEILPVEIRNASDIKTLEDYVAQNGDKLDYKQKAIILSLADSINKQAEVAEQAEKENPEFQERPEVKYIEGGFYLDDMNHPKGKTSKNGCWSVCYESMIASRGVKGVTQEHIRSVRPKLGENTKAEMTKNKSADRKFQSDDPQDITEFTDNALAFAPNNMIRMYEVKAPGEAQFYLKQNEQINRRDYINATCEAIRKKIEDAIKIDRSPVALTTGGHYINIIGLTDNGDVIYLETNNKGNAKKTRSLRDIVNTLFRGNNPVQLVWMSDIKLSKDGETIHNVPSRYLKANKDGSLKLPPEKIYNDGMLDKKPAEYNGIRVRLFSGVDDTAEDKDHRSMLSKAGIVDIEQAYIPKKLNIKFLRKDMKARSAEDEEALCKRTVALVGENIYGPDITNRKAKNEDALENRKREAPSLERILHDDHASDDAGIGSNRRFINQDEKSRTECERLKALYKQSVAPELFAPVIVKQYRKIKEGRASVTEKEGFELFMKEEIDLQKKRGIFNTIIRKNANNIIKLGNSSKTEFNLIRQGISGYGIPDSDIKHNAQLSKDIADFATTQIYSSEIDFYELSNAFLDAYFNDNQFNKDTATQIVLSAKNEEQRNDYLYGFGILGKQAPEGISVAKDGIDKEHKKITLIIPEEVIERERQIQHRLNLYSAYEEDRLTFIRIALAGPESPKTVSEADVTNIAEQIAIAELQETKPINRNNLSTEEAIAQRETEKRGKLNRMVDDPHFTGFLKQAGIRTFRRSDVDNKKAAWNNFKVSLDEEINRITTSEEPVVNLPGYDDSYFTLEELQRLFGSIADEMKGNEPLDYVSGMKQAAKAAVCNFLSGPGAKRMFFGKGTDWNNQEQKELRGKLKAAENGQYKRADVMIAVKDLRDSMLQDPMFIDALAKHPTLDKFYDTFKQSVNIDMDTMLAKDKEHQRAVKRGEVQANNETITLSEEDIIYLKKTRNELDTIYKSSGKYRSEYMKNIYGKLKEIIEFADANADPSDKSVTMPAQKMEELKHHSLTYYDERKGVIFNPFTNRGKARLEMVKDLAQKTDKMSQKKNGPNM